MEGSDKEGTVQIFRPFAESESTAASADLKVWIGKHERPVVYNFDDRTISNMFG